MTPEDQIRQLHEAYQFLLKKYKLGEDSKATEALVSPFMKLEMDEKPVIVMKEETAAEESEKEKDEKEEAKIDEPKTEPEKKAVVKEDIKVEENGSEKEEVNVENILDLVMGTEKKDNEKKDAEKNGSIKRNSSKTYARTSSKKKKGRDSVGDLDLDVDPKSGSLKRKKSATRSSRNKRSEN